MSMICRFSVMTTFLLLLFLLAHPASAEQRHSRISIQGRFSYSLTTFDPSGKLIQLEHAQKASSLGVPIVAVVLDGKNDSKEGHKHGGDDKGGSLGGTPSSPSDPTILIAAPQLLPSPLMSDDGTARFVAVSPHIVIGHSGVAADGRVVTQKAQTIAVQHTYLYDEPIPIGLFLEELSLLMQEYTMKPASRPYAVSLIVGYIPPKTPSTNHLEEEEDNGENECQLNRSGAHKPRLFRIDCTGSVEELGDVAIINGNFRDIDALHSKLWDLSSGESSRTDIRRDSSSSTREDNFDNRQRLTEILLGELEHRSFKGNYGDVIKDDDDNVVVGADDNSEKDESANLAEVTDDERKENSNRSTVDQKIKLPLRIISCSFCPRNGLDVYRQLVVPSSSSKRKEDTVQ